jgi:hypothetical protein
MGSSQGRPWAPWPPLSANPSFWARSRALRRCRRIIRPLTHPVCHSTLEAGRTKDPRPERMVVAPEPQEWLARIPQTPYDNGRSDKRHEAAVMAIHVRWDPPEGSAVLTAEELGPPLPDKDAARRAVQMRYSSAYYGEPMPGLTYWRRRDHPCLEGRGVAPTRGASSGLHRADFLVSPLLRCRKSGNGRRELFARQGTLACSGVGGRSSFPASAKFPSTPGNQHGTVG